MSRPHLRRDLAAIKRRLQRAPSQRPDIEQWERELRENEAVYTKFRRAFIALDASVLEPERVNDTERVNEFETVG